MVDVACGTGVVARLAAARVGPAGAVTGVDVTPGMLAVARSISADGPPIEWHEASAGKLPLPDASADVVLCSLGLQFFPDREAALREMRRILVPGGRLAVNAPGPSHRCSWSCTMRSASTSAPARPRSSARCSRCTAPTRSGDC